MLLQILIILNLLYLLIPILKDLVSYWNTLTWELETWNCMHSSCIVEHFELETIEE